MMLTPIVYQTLVTGVSSLITGLFGLGGLLAGAWRMVWGALGLAATHKGLGQK